MMDPDVHFCWWRGLASALTGQAGASRLCSAWPRPELIPPRVRTSGSALFNPAAALLMGAFPWWHRCDAFSTCRGILNFGHFVGFILVKLSVTGISICACDGGSGMGLLTNCVSANRSVMFFMCG